MLLASMNKRLVEDQGSRNPYTLGEFEERIGKWLNGEEWQIDLFERAESTVGYSVYRFQADYYFPEQEVVYLRQFYIESEYRGRGLGRAAYRLLATQRFGGKEVSIDVLATNPGGQEFWAKLGFEPYLVAMKKA